jgi:hypothetical protein
VTCVFEPLPILIPRWRLSLSQGCVNCARANDTHRLPGAVAILSSMTRDDLFVAALIGASIFSMAVLAIALFLR